MAMPREDGSQGFTLHRVRREKGNNDELVAMELKHDNPDLELLGRESWSYIRYCSRLLPESLGW